MNGTMTPQQPFSTIISVKVLQLIRARDLEMARYQEQFRKCNITREELVMALEASDATIADDILEVCTRTISTLEATVDKVLQLQAQMQVLREAQ